MRLSYVIPLTAAVLLGACGSPAKVSRLTVVNTTSHDLAVEVSDVEREGWLPVGILQAGSAGTWREVIDQGETWIFRFQYRGEPVGEIELQRAELDERGWRIEVPPEVDQRIQELE